MQTSNSPNAPSESASEQARPSAAQRSAAPRSAAQRPPLQFSLGFLLLLTLVMAMMGGGLMYASLVPAVQEELSLLTGAEVPELSARAGRSAHIGFIMFTFTSPLILAGVLSTALAVFRWLVRSGRIRPTVIATHDAAAAPPVSPTRNA